MYIYIYRIKIFLSKHGQYGELERTSKIEMNGIAFIAGLLKSNF